MKNSSISDFSSLASNGVVNASAETPSWFGTNRCGISDEDISNDDRVTNSIECPEYQVFSYNGSDWNSCPVTSARDYYGLPDIRLAFAVRLGFLVFLKHLLVECCSIT